MINININKSLSLYECLAKILNVSNTEKFRKRVKEIILGLDEYKRNILINKYGENFDKVFYSKDVNEFYDDVLNKIIYYIVWIFNYTNRENKCNKKNNGFKILVIYDRLSGLLNEENTLEFRRRIDSIISQLEDSDKKIIVKAYGNNLNIVNRSSDWIYKKDSIELRRVIYKIKNIYRLNYIGITTNKCFVMFYSYLSSRLNIEDCYSFRLKVKKIILQLDDNEIKILKKIYGPSFTEINKCDNYDDEDVRKRYSIMEKLLKLLNANLINSELYIIDFIVDTNYNILVEACNMLPNMDKSIVIRLFGDDYSSVFSMDNVSSRELEYFENNLVEKINNNIIFLVNRHSNKKLFRNKSCFI